MRANTAHAPQTATVRAPRRTRLRVRRPACERPARLRAASTARRHGRRVPPPRPGTTGRDATPGDPFEEFGRIRLLRAPVPVETWEIAPPRTLLRRSQRVWLIVGLSVFSALFVALAALAYLLVGRRL